MAQTARCSPTEVCAVYSWNDAEVYRKSPDTRYYHDFRFARLYETTTL